MIRDLVCVLAVTQGIIFVTQSVEELLGGLGPELVFSTRQNWSTLKNDTLFKEQLKAAAWLPEHCAKDKPGGETCDRIRAAGWFHGVLIFIQGKQFISVSKKTRKEIRNGNVDRLDIPDDIDAYVDWSGNWGHYFFKGPNYYSDVLGYLRGPLDSATEWNRFFENGIDAAANRNGITHFFKGCKFITWPSYWKGGSDSSDTPAKLPCYIDAAWEEDNGNSMEVLVDDQIWNWSANNIVKGPFNFTDNYKIKSLNLCKFRKECLRFE